VTQKSMTILSIYNQQPVSKREEAIKQKKNRKGSRVKLLRIGDGSESSTSARQRVGPLPHHV
jgi:hypothetical protein